MQIDDKTTLMFRQVMRDHAYKMNTNENSDTKSRARDEEYDEVEFVSKNGDSLLISLVQNYPHLYVKSSKLQKDHALREKSWQEIAAVLKQPAGECLKRWTRLRERYSKEKRLNEQNVKNEMKTIGRQCWPHYEEMAFLAQHIVGRRSYRNIHSRSKRILYEQQYPNDILSSSDHASLSSSAVPFASTLIVSSSSPSPSMSTALVHSPELLSPETSELGQAFQHSNENGNRMESIEESMSDHLQNNIQQSETSEDLFCKYLASELKKMSESEKKATTRRLMDALFKGDT